MNISKIQGILIVIMAVATGFITPGLVFGQPLAEEGDRQVVDGEEMEIKCHNFNMSIVYSVCMLESID
jgi:hypothetical protein